ncbi:tRNA threonylcarbamoyladenosine biosynthesis protein RimN [Sulfuricella sp. T08]|uniref:L-threonylcarbamoyladenylate synthase n=1 Tax=Sulfuricella sp. T08 TaxID=1632857 RepID=UPI00061795F9|nr:Sua5/YciO/YrdC/YwlC family protein [Sulfuricella sp. T08]GAO37313.1 tRNA threonylcarbamoyladenosine biosynthesis protein RimN [Sulfuricella sp. T08]
MPYPAALIRKVRAHLNGDGIIAYATESCYGLGCDPRSYRAVRRILQLKNRPQFKGLILIADRFSRLRRYVLPPTEEQSRQLDRAWPGPHTWLMPASRHTPRWLRGRHESIAVRVTAHPDAAELCRALGTALVSTSANRAGLKPLRTYAACVKAFGQRVLALPGRVGARKNPSTIQHLLTGRIIRP